MPHVLNWRALLRIRVNKTFFFSLPFVLRRSGTSGNDSKSGILPDSAIRLSGSQILEHTLRTLAKNRYNHLSTLLTPLNVWGLYCPNKNSWQNRCIKRKDKLNRPYSIERIYLQRIYVKILRKVGKMIWNIDGCEKTDEYQQMKEQAQERKTGKLETVQLNWSQSTTC